MSQTTSLPTYTPDPVHVGRWMVVIFNNDTNSFDEVIDVLIEATGCDNSEAAIEAWEAHHYGKAPVHFSSRDDCQVAADIINAVGVKAEVSLEWED